MLDNSHFASLEKMVLVEPIIWKTLDESDLLTNCWLILPVKIRQNICDIIKLFQTPGRDVPLEGENQHETGFDKIVTIML